MRIDLMIVIGLASENFWKSHDVSMRRIAFSFSFFAEEYLV